MSEQIKKLHEVYTSGHSEEQKEQEVSPALANALTKPHLAVMIGPNEWMPVVPGMIIALITDRSKVNGIAPYILTKVNTKPGREFLDMVAWSTNPNNRRKLRLGAKYSGNYASPITDADQASDAAIAAVKDTESKP